MKSELLIEMVDKAKQGDEHALQVLYFDAYKSVYFLALRMLKTPEDAEDMTQEVFIIVHQKISKLRQPAAFYKWVNHIAVNKCNEFLRSYRGLAALDDDEEVAMLLEDDPLALPDKAIDDAETRRIILEVVDGLPFGQRACVMYYYYQQYTIAQIADYLEINENTVKSRLSLARAKIRHALEEKEKREGIKLYGIPLALTPIFQQALDTFSVQEGVAARMWDHIFDTASAGTLPASVTVTVGSEAAGTTVGGALAAKITAFSVGLKAALVSAVVVATVAAVGVPVYINHQDKLEVKSPEPAVAAVSEVVASEAEPPVDDGSAPVPSSLRFEQSNEGNMVYWAVSDFAQRVAGFEFSAAAIGSDNWKALVSVPADYGGYQIERVAAYLTDGEYILKLTSIPQEGYKAAEAIIDGILVVKTGNHVKNSYTAEDIGGGFEIHGLDAHQTVYFLTITRDGSRIGDIYFFDTINGVPQGFSSDYLGTKSGDICTLREHLQTDFDGTSYTVHYAKPSDPFVMP